MKKLFTVLVALLLLLGITGCGNNEKAFEDMPAGTPTVLILGHHSGMNKVFTSAEAVDDYIGDSLREAVGYYREGERYCAELKLKILISDSSPDQVQLYDMFGDPIEFRVSNYNTKALSNSVEDLLEDVKEALCSDTLVANDEEVDMVAALMAAKLILNNQKAEKRNLIIVDYGFSTTGLLNMHNTQILAEDIPGIVDGISANACPDLNGIDVSFYNMGNVSDTQEDHFKFDSNFDTKLKQFWTLYLVERCHVPANTLFLQCVQNQGVPLNYNADNPDASALKYVSNVVFSLPEPPPTEEPPEPPTKPIVLNTAQLGFVAGEATFKDEAAANRSLDNYKSTFDALKEHGIRIYVVGSVAKTTPTQKHRSDEISRKRAQKVADMIAANYGVPASQIVVIDAGVTPFSWRNGEEFPTNDPNKWDENAMQQNRVVAVIPETANEVQELINSGYVKP